MARQAGGGREAGITLRDLALAVKDAVESLGPDFWVRAELAQVNLNAKSGHCYLDLVEKEEDRVVAQMRANIWAQPYKKLSSDFLRATGSPLGKGMKVLLLARVTFHEVFGLSLSVRDIDPSYTLGEMAMKRKETLERLEREGLIDRNRRLPEPLVPLRVAVIASETSAGYGDFIERLNNNPYGYAFKTSLFSAYMQGDRTEASVVEALAQAMQVAERFDLAVIIRGGGSQVDLHAFDAYGLARAVALSTLPVLTGIGHERDESVVDRVANKRLITPSAVAEYLVSRVRAFEDRVDLSMRRMAAMATGRMAEEGQRLALINSTLVASARRLTANREHELSALGARFRHAGNRVVLTVGSRLRLLMQGVAHKAEARLHFNAHKLSGVDARLRASYGYVMKSAPTRLGALSERLGRASARKVERAADRLGLLETKTSLLDPSKVLSRGYSITYLEGTGKALKEASGAREGQKIVTVLYKGRVESTIENIIENIKTEEES